MRMIRVFIERVKDQWLPLGHIAGMLGLSVCVLFPNYPEFMLLNIACRFNIHKKSRVVAHVGVG